MSRLDEQRQEELEPQRMEWTKKQFEGMGYKIDDIELNGGKGFTITTPKGLSIQFWPYSGWWSGKGIGQGRGFSKLVKAIEATKKGAE